MIGHVLEKPKSLLFCLFIPLQPKIFQMLRCYIGSNYLEMNIISQALSLIFFCLIFQSGSAQDINKLDASGKKHGIWQGLFEESKRVRYEGQFDHGKEVGLFKYYDDTKAHPVIATRDFGKGGNAAYTIFYDQQKNIVSEGKIVDRQYEGLWKYYHKASPAVMTTENYVGGKLEGKRSVYYLSGKIAEETMYKAGIKNGPYKKYAENGVVLEESNYVNGAYHGSAVHRDPSGQIVGKGDYKDGGKFGYWEFYQDGKLTKREKYPIQKAKRPTAKQPVIKENVEPVKTADTKG